MGICVIAHLSARKSILLALRRGARLTPHCPVVEEYALRREHGDPDLDRRCLVDSAIDNQPRRRLDPPEGGTTPCGFLLDRRPTLPGDGKGDEIGSIATDPPPTGRRDDFESRS